MAQESGFMILGLVLKIQISGIRVLDSGLSRVLVSGLRNQDLGSEFSFQKSGLRFQLQDSWISAQDQSCTDY